MLDIASKNCRFFRATIAAVLASILLAGIAGCAGFRLPAIDPSGRGIFLPNPNFTTLAGDGPLGRLLHGGATLGGGGLGGGIGTPRLGGCFGGGIRAGLRQHHDQLARLFGGGCLLNGLPNVGTGGCCLNGARLGGCLNGGCQLMQGLGNGIHGLGRGCLGLAGGIGNCGLASCSLCSGGSGSCGPGSVGAGAFSVPSTPPLCGADGQAPSGSPCYPVGSPTASSLAATLPGSQVGSGLSRSLPSATSGCDAYNGPIGSQVRTPFSNQLSSQQRALGINQQQFGPGVVISQPRLRANVGQEVVLLGGIQTGTGVARPNELVQWSLANNSVGTFVDAAKPATRGGTLFRIFRKGPSNCSTGTCGNCVPSITARQCEHLVRSPNDPNDDIYLSRGQSWVSLTSASPGMSYVTLSAPQACGRKFANAIVEWVAADDAYSAPINPQGPVSPPDANDFQPLIDRSEPATSPSDSIPPREFDPPTNTGELPPLGASTPVPLAQQDRAELAIRADGPPGGEVGEPLDYLITVTNNSKTEAQRVVVSMDNLPAGVQYVNSDTRPQPGQSLAWVFESLAPGESETINVRLASDRPIQLGNRFYATARNALGEVDFGVNTEVFPPSLLLELLRNEPFTPRAGTTFQQPIQIVNQVPRQQNVKVQIIDWERGIEPIVPDAGVQPNASRGVDQIVQVGGNGRQVSNIEFRAIEPGTHRFRVVATNEETQKQVTREGQVRVLASERPLEPHMQVNVTGPTTLDPGQSDRITISVQNDGQVPITNGNLIVGTEGDIGISGDGRARQLDDRTLVWDFETLRPGEGAVVEISMRANRNPATTGGLLKAEARSEQGTAAQEFPVQIREFRSRPRRESRSGRTSHVSFGNKPRSEMRQIPRVARDEFKSLSMKITAREAARIDEPIEYELVVENNNPRSFRNVQVSISVASGMHILDLGSPTGSHHKVASDRRTVDFETIKEVLPRERLLFRVRAAQTQRGRRAKLLGQLYATGLSAPLTVVKETITN